MTLLFAGLFLVFGFLAVRHFRNGRLFWGLMTGLGCLLMAGAVWVDFQRAAAETDDTASSAQVEPAEAAPVIRDYDPNANSDPARVQSAGQEANENQPKGKADDTGGE